MLSSLSIDNLVLIDHVALDFQQGLGVLTGETGAGKSILLDALGLCLGARADSALVRAGTDKAEAIASFEQLPEQDIQAIFADLDIIYDASEPLIVRRQVKKDGGSRAWINDRPVSASTLQAIAPFLAEVHGQHDGHGLLNPKSHAGILDSYAGIDHDALSGSWRTAQKAYKIWQSAEAAYHKAIEDKELLAHQLEELREFNPQEGEEERLAHQRSDMQKGARLADDMAEISAFFDGSDGALAVLRVTARKLGQIAAEHPLLEETLEALDRSIIEADTAQNSLNEAILTMEHDPDRLDDVEMRLFDLRALARKHNVTGDQLPQYLEELERRWQNIEQGGENLAELKAGYERARADFDAQVEKTRAARMAAASQLDEAVQRELPPLKLQSARFQTTITPLPPEKWNGQGGETIEFLISTNPGSDFAPLAKIASGGELSRFMLALKVALAEKEGSATLIFDEIDAGVGGAVASAIGERLEKLADKGQVLVVTHSPQVAARAAQHFYIAKSVTANDTTLTNVRILDRDERRTEIARMLSGAEITAEAHAQAERLIEKA